MTLWDPVRLRAAALELRWSNGRTTMRRFSARLSPQAGVSCCFFCGSRVECQLGRGRFLLANAGGSTWTRGSSITVSGQFE